MTIIVKIGRRVPKSFKSRFISKIQGLIGFQENIWLMIGMSFNASKKKWANGSKKGKGKIDLIDIAKNTESEDSYYNLQWLIITIKGDIVGEQEEFEEAMNMYSNLKGVLKKAPKMEDNDRLKAVFKTKMINEDNLKEAYSAGFGASKDKNISNILLEMGLLTCIERIDDFDTRVPTPDF